MSEASQDIRELDRAYEDGKRIGRRSGATQADCPFTRDHLHLRIAWMDGFSDGQWEGSKRHAAICVASRFFGSGIAQVVTLPDPL